jgi:hypothetical protein
MCLSALGGKPFEAEAKTESKVLRFATGIASSLTENPTKVAVAFRVSKALPNENPIHS